MRLNGGQLKCVTEHRMPLTEAELGHLRFAGEPASDPARRVRLSVDDLRRRQPTRSSLRARPTDRAALDAFIHAVLRRAGIEPAGYRPACLERRLPACLRALRVADTTAAEARLTAEPELLNVALDAFLLGVSSFFRDGPVFDQLRSVLPRLASAAPGLRVWSVGCSDGAELYSVAIVLAELGLLDGSSLLGTDCRPSAVAQARAACYGPAALEHVDPVIRRKYFTQQDGRFRLLPSLLARTEVRCCDFLGKVDGACPDGPPWDVILWRNAAIYLQPGAARDVWTELFRQLRPGGLLISGKAERPECEVPVARLGPCIYMRRGS